MNETAAAGAKERDPLADVERQGPLAWALHSIRTRYSLATAFFLLLALAMFYVGGRIVLVHLIHDAERQVKEIGVDVSRLAYRRADAVRQAAANALAAADGGRLDPAKCVESGGFSLAVEFAADGAFSGGSLRGVDGAERPVLAEELAPYADFRLRVAKKALGGAEAGRDGAQAALLKREIEIWEAVRACL